MSETKRHQSARMLRDIDGLRYLTVGQLRAKYLEVFRQASCSNHKQFLVRRIAWRLQANAEGDLSERARRRAEQIAEEADLRVRAPESFLKEQAERNRDPRLSPTGTWLNRQFKATRYQWRCWRRCLATGSKCIDRSAPWRVR